MLHRRRRRRARSKPIERAKLRIAFGKATWPHQLVRIMLLEQVYRAATILSESSLPSGLTASRVLILTFARASESKRREQIYDFSAVFRFDVAWRVFRSIQGTSIPGTGWST